MKTKKPLAVRIFIRICVVAMVVSLVGVYVVYMIAPQQPVEEVDETNTESTEVIIPELNPDNPEESGAPILVTEDGEVNEMDQIVEVELENGQTELVRLGDLTDAIQIN